MARLPAPPFPFPRPGRYLGLAGLFFFLSLASILLVHHLFAGGRVTLPASLFTARSLLGMGLLLCCYFLADGLRLYAVLRAMALSLSPGCLARLVFINLFVSNVTPLATGGGVVQVYFMRRAGISVGAAMAATSIRTMLAGFLLFTLAPLIIWTQPERFAAFLHPHLIQGITLVSLLYLLGFWMILFRIRIIRKLVHHSLGILTGLGLLSADRSRRLTLKVSRELNLFSRGFGLYLRGPRGWIFLSFLCTALFLFFLFAFSLLLLSDFGYHIPALTVIAFQVVVTFFMYFAPTPGASGVAETGYGLLFSQLVRPRDLAALTLCWRLLTIHLGVLIGMIVLVREFRKKKAGRPGGTP